MLTEKDYLLIENYLEGNLKHEEKTSFEKRLLSNKELLAAIKYRKQLEELIIEADEYKKTKDFIINSLSKNKQPFYKKGLFFYLFAASAVLFLGIYLVFVKHNNNTNNSIADNINVVNNKVIKPNINKPGEYSSVNYLKNLTLIIPSNNDTININKPVTFKWYIKNSTNKTLYIKNLKTKEIVFTKDITAKNDSMELKLKLKNRQWYIWYINDTLPHNRFFINY